jgi:siroheme synthase-like protein
MVACSAAALAQEDRCRAQARVSLDRRVDRAATVRAMSSLYPLFLRLGGRRVVVVGGGAVASRKVEELLDAGASVHVVAPALAPSIEQAAARGTLTAAVRAFADADLDGAWLVIAATDDAAVNRAVAAAAEVRRVFVNAVDDPPNASAYFASIVRRAPFQIAISSSGELPALSRLLREVIEHVLPTERWIEVARGLRRRWRADGVPMGERFGELVREFAETSRPNRSLAFAAGNAGSAGSPPDIPCRERERAAPAFTIEAATAVDVPDMARMAASLVRQHHDFDALRFMLVDEVEKGYAWWFSKCLGDEHSVMLVAKVEGRAVGYTYGVLEERDWNQLLDAHGAIHDVWVEAEARKGGVARALVTEACARLKAMGAPRVVLHTASKNARAQAFFASAGFRSTMIEMTREL